MPDEDAIGVDAAGPSVSEVESDGSTNLERQRQNARFARLGFLERECPVPPIDGANSKIGHFLRPETEDCHAECHGEVAAACRARAEAREKPPKVRVAESLWKPTELGVSDDWNCAAKRADVDAADFQKAQ